MAYIVESHDLFLKPFIDIYREVDTNLDGVINEVRVYFHRFIYQFLRFSDIKIERIQGDDFQDRPYIKIQSGYKSALDSFGSILK